MTEVQALVTPEQTLDALKRVATWADELSLMYAWIATGEGSDAHWRALPIAKVRRALIGVHFAQTEPWALRMLSADRERLRVVEDTAGVFHPKALLARRGNRGHALVGSSNFTRGGFLGNTEVNLLLEGNLQDEPLRTLFAAFEAEWTSSRAQSIDEDWLLRYERAYASRPKPPQLPRPPRSRPVAVERAEQLDVGWDEYYDLIARRERHTLRNGFEIHIFDHAQGSYLQEIEACANAFARSPQFASMSEEDRKRVTGWGAETSGYFGRNVGAGYFKQLVRTEPEKLARHLDLIPTRGPVDRGIADRVLSGLVELHGVGLGVASRMLCAKRPDLFVTINNANRDRVRALFGRAPTSATAYLDWHERIWAYPWRSAPEPTGGRDERRVWRARVALVDSLVYEIPY